MRLEKCLLCTILGALSLFIFYGLKSAIHLEKTNFSSTTATENASYQKIKRISFLKIEKTGSSTVACIFLRFGIKNNLRMFLPHYTFVSGPKQRYLLQQERRFDIFAIHTLYDYNFFTNIVQNSAIIGLVRDPVQRIISEIFFKSIMKRRRERMNLGQQEFANEVVKNTSEYRVQNTIAKFFQLKSPIKQENLDKLNSKFLLVLILERLDESLVLLKRLLNWSVVDIIYAKKKVNNHQKIFLNESQRMHLHSTEKLDFDIYHFFSQELNRKIINEGQGFKEEVLYFEHILEKVEHFCTNSSNNNLKHYFPASKWEDSFSISSKECELIFKLDVGGIKKKFSTE